MPSTHQAIPMNGSVAAITIEQTTKLVSAMKHDNNDDNDDGDDYVGWQWVGVMAMHGDDCDDNNVDGDVKQMEEERRGEARLEQDGWRMNEWMNGWIVG